MSASFESWLAAVDAACERLCGLSVHDLPDCPFRDWFADGYSPARAARKAIRRIDHDDD